MPVTDRSPERGAGPEPRLEDRVHRLRGLLLDPVGDAGQESHDERLHEPIRTNRQAFVERRVLLAPDQQRRDLQRRVGSRRRGRSGILERAVVVHHRRECPRLTGGGTIHVHDRRRKPAPIGRQPPKYLTHQPRSTGTQRALRQPGNLAHGDVPGAEGLREPADAGVKERGVRHVHDDQTLERALVSKRERPGNGATPVVADEHDRGRVGVVNQRRDVRDQVVDRVVLHTRRPGCSPVPAQVGCPCSESESRKHRKLVAP